MWLSFMTGRRITLRALATALLLSLWVMAGVVSAPGASAQRGSGPELTGTIVFQTVSGGPIYAVTADALRYLTTGMDPALSPDGQWVAFTRWDDTQHGATGSLWVINVDGSGERVILGDVRQPKAPAWSPDGTRLAISMQQGGRLGPEPKCSHELPSEPLLADEDGDYFRVVVEDGDVKYCYTLLPHPFWGLWVVEVATGAYEDLPGDRFSYAPTWDPANDWRLVFDGEQGLVNLDLKQGTTWPLTGDVRDHAPVFSPDGRKIAVSYKQHDHWDIHVINADALGGMGGSGRVRRTETPLRVIVEQRIKEEEGGAWNNVAPTWSPDGSQIAFLSDRTGRWEIWIMAADGSHQRPLFPDGTLDRLTFQYNHVDERMLSWR
jgi:dipeptidyl aminopeptidase/acylaminoacyl peptidase